MAVVPSIAFGTLLRRWRKAAGLTQEELAERAGLSVRGISDLERGLKHRPHRDTVQLLVDALQLGGQDRSVFESAGRRLGPSSTAGRYADPDGTLTTSDERTTALQTFLIADIRGYTRFTLEQGDEAAARLTSKFARLTREVVAAREGSVIELRGDEVLAVFSSSRQALRAASQLHERFVQETEEDPSLPLGVGIGLDAGEAIPVEGGYRGTALNLAARLCALAGSGEVLATETVEALARRTEGLVYLERGSVQLKGFADPVRVLQVVPELGQAENDDAGGAPSTEAPLPIGGFLGALPAGVLVARDEELGRLLKAVDTVAGGSGRLVMLAGEPGVGKTRLAQEVTLAARNREFLVASGRCYEPQQVVPYYPFLEALSTAYRAAPSTVRAEVPRRWPYLGRLLPDELVPPAESSAEGCEEQQRLFRAVTGFLQALAGEMPVALVLDDLHWADSVTLELLQHLARHTRAYRILLLGTYRDVEVGRQHPLEQPLRDLYREQLMERVAIKRLRQEGTAVLMAASFGDIALSEKFVGLVHRHTEGNPFFTQEVLRALVERGDVCREDGGWSRHEPTRIEVPETVRSAIGERVSRLDKQTQEILHEASVLGQTFTFDDLQQMGGRSEAEVETALEESTTAGLVWETGRDGYGFNHALTQQALCADLSARRRRKLHLAAGEMLERHPEEVRQHRAAELAWHFLEGDDPEQALRYSQLAGEQADAVFAHGEAERHYRTALDLARETGDKAGEVEALEMLGTVLRRVLRYDEALELLQRAASMRRAEADHEGEGRVEAEITRVHAGRGTPDEGITRLGSLLESLEARVSVPVLANLYEAQARLFFHSGRYREQLPVAERLVQLARAAKDDRILAMAQARHGTALVVLGRADDAICALEEAIPLAEAVGNLEALRRALNEAAECYEAVGLFEKAIEYRERHLAVAERLSDPGWISFSLCNLAQTLILLGEWARARVHLERAVGMTLSLAGWWSSYPPCCLGRLCLLEGNWEGAPRHLREGIAIAAQNGDIQGLRSGQCTLAELDLLQGRPEAVLSRLAPLLDRPGLEEALVTYLLPVLAEAQLELGKMAEAEELAAKAVTRAASQRDRVSLVHALRTQGMVLLRQEYWDEARQVLDEGLELARSMPYPYAVGLILFQMGLIPSRRHKPEQARERLEEALDIFQRLGARKDVERTGQALAELDHA